VTTAPIPASPAPPMAGQPAHEGVIIRRCLAFFVDLILIACISALGLLATCTVNVISLGALTPATALIMGLLPAFYAMFGIASRWHATPGMRLFGLRVVDAACLGDAVPRDAREDGPGWLQGFLMPALFYATAVPSGMLVLAIAFFNGRNRCLHDYLSGTVVLRRNG